MNVTSLFYSIITKKSLHFTTYEYHMIRSLEQKNLIIYQNNTLTFDQIQTIKLQLKPILQKKFFDQIDHLIISTDDFIKISSDTTSLVTEVPKSTELFHKKISHPAKLLGSYKKNDKEYAVVQLLRTTNNKGEKLLINVDCGKKIPQDQVKEFRKDYENEFNNLLNCGMIFKENDDYIRAGASGIYGPKGNQPLKELYNISEKKIQCISEIYIKCEKDNLSNYFVISERKLNKEQSQELNNQGMLKSKHCVLNIESVAFEEIGTEEVKDFPNQLMNDNENFNNRIEYE